MFDANFQGEEENRKKALITSIIVHLLIFLIFFVPFFYNKSPLQQIGGIVVSFGLPEAGSTNTNPESQNEKMVEAVAETEEVTNSKRERSAAPEKAIKTIEVPQNKIPETNTNDLAEISDVVLAKKEKERSDAKAKVEAEEKRKEAEDLARKESEKISEEEEQKAEFEARKKKFGDLLSGGQGNNNTTGNQRDPNGDPDRSTLENITEGAGQIGEGLSNRDLIFEPKIIDDSQQTGKVVVRVCVDKSGKVTSAKFTQRGSTTTDKHLIDVAVSGAKKYRFSSGDADNQCGIITINFLVQ